VYHYHQKTGVSLHHFSPPMNPPMFSPPVLRMVQHRYLFKIEDESCPRWLAGADFASDEVWRPLVSSPHRRQVGTTRRFSADDADRGHGRGRAVWPDVFEISNPVVSLCQRTAVRRPRNSRPKKEKQSGPSAAGPSARLSVSTSP
jgi:hypothetical protein